LHPAIPLTDLDDSTLISQRREMRTALEKLPPKSQAAQSLVKQYDALSSPSATWPRIDQTFTRAIRAGQLRADQRGIGDILAGVGLKP
jgi:murein L,D-transpeptidase YcbB/YkuD